MGLKSKKAFRWVLYIGLMFICANVFVACSSKDKPVNAEADQDVEASETSAQVSPTASAEPTPLPVPTRTPQPTEDITGKALSKLNGYYIDEAIAKRRPMAVVINNRQVALPQSGIRQADILYEVLAEGNITRLVAIFQDFDTQKIGSVRSARHYFIDFAYDYDAVFVHHGGSPQAYDLIAKNKVNDLDGMKLEGKTFWRDPARAAIKSMYEHSSYTNAERILSAIEAAGYRNVLNEDLDVGFTFLSRFAKLMGAEDANYIRVPFSNEYVSIFEYDKEKRLYYKWNSEKKHIDEETGDQLSFSNLLIQQTRIFAINGDTAGRREVDTVGKGKGYYMTAGGYVPVLWEKKSQKEPTRWYFENGDPIRLNRGKTFICVVSPDTKLTMEVRADE